MQPLNPSGHRGQESTSPEDAQTIAAWCLVASSVLQHGTKDHDTTYDNSVHRSTGFAPSPHLGTKLLGKKELLEELRWERTSEPLGVCWTNCCWTEAEAPVGQVGTIVIWHTSHISVFSFSNFATSSLWSRGPAMEQSCHYFSCYSVFDKQDKGERIARTRSGVLPLLSCSNLQILLSFCSCELFPVPVAGNGNGMFILTVLFFTDIYFWGVFCRQTTNAQWEVDLWVTVSQDGQETFDSVKPNSG